MNTAPISEVFGDETSCFFKSKKRKIWEICVFSSVNSSNFANILEIFSKIFYLKKLEKKFLNLSPFLKTKSTYVIYTLIFLVMERPMEVAPIT